MLKKFVLPAFALVVSFAQPPMGGPGGPGGAAPSVTELKAYLNLSDTQVTSITSANAAARDASRALAQQMQTKQQALQTAITNGSTDAAAIGRAVLDIAAIRKQLDAAQAKVREQAVSFLSADQKLKLKTLDDADKLRPAIGEAHALQLLAPPAGAAGPGPGPGPRRFGNLQQ